MIWKGIKKHWPPSMGSNLLDQFCRLRFCNGQGGLNSAAFSSSGLNRPATCLHPSSLGADGFQRWWRQNPGGSSFPNRYGSPHFNNRLIDEKACCGADWGQYPSCWPCFVPSSFDVMHWHGRSVGVKSIEICMGLWAKFFMALKEVKKEQFRLDFCNCSFDLGEIGLGIGLVLNL